MAVAIFFYFPSVCLLTERKVVYDTTFSGGQAPTKSVIPKWPYSSIPDCKASGKWENFIKETKAMKKITNILVITILCLVVQAQEPVLSPRLKEYYRIKMEMNNLYDIALKDIPNEEILEAFTKAHLPEMLFDDLVAFVDVVKKPIAVRSSSLLEDAHYQPFAGVYSTYMVPYDEASFLVEFPAVFPAIRCEKLQNGVY